MARSGTDLKMAKLLSFKLYIDTFYNILNQSHQDSLNSVAGVSSASGSSTQDAAITALTKQVEALVSSMNRPINSIQNGCETCGAHAYYECQAVKGYTQEDVYATMGTYNLTNPKERPQGVLPSNTVPNPREDLKVITTRSGVTLVGPLVPPHLSSSKEPSPISIPSKLPPVPASSSVIPDFLQMFKKPYFNISFAKALAHMPKYAKMVKDLLTNKEKLLELANTPLNENCSVVLFKKLPEKLRDTGRFLIPCDFYGLELCMALADLADIAKDVFVQVGKFTFTADFVVVNYDVDPRVPLIIGRPFLRTAHALVDVHGEELTLRVGDEKLVFNIESTLKYPRKHGDESIHKIDILDITCEDHFHEVSKEIDTFLASNDLILPYIDDGIFDPEGDIRLIEELLNNEIPNDLPPPLHVFEINENKKIKTSIDDPLDLELKDLPFHLGYAFLAGTSKLPVIIAKDLKREEKE
ncbi:reverse transcriptase domain-containing protein [Tanacetum coccineum]